MDRVAQQITLDPYSSIAPKVVAIVDADALLSSIDNQCRTGRRSRILRMAGSRASCVYAARHVYGETYRGFKKIAANSSASIDDLRACFEEHYLPVLRWVETNGDGIADDRVAQVIDETDVPTAELASLIAPCLVLSEDRALRRPGYAPDRWRLAAGHGAEIVEGFEMLERVTIVVGLPVVGFVGGGVKLGEAARVPWWASLGLLGLGGYVILRSARRREVIGRKVKPLVEAVCAMVVEATAREQDGVRGLKEMMFAPAAPPTAKQQVATVVARSQMPLVATEVHERIGRCFDRSVTLHEVRAILKGSPEFTQPERYRWQLGQIRGPWRGVLSS